MSLQSTFVKFRIPTPDKARLVNAARSADTSLSALMRRTAIIVAAGPRSNRDARLEIAEMRAAANALHSAIEELKSDSSGVSIRLREAAAKLHRIAERQLGANR